MRHPAFVVTHRHRTLQVAQFHLALTRRLLAVEIGADAGEQDNDEQGKNGEDAFHGDSLCMRDCRPSGCKQLAQTFRAVHRCPRKVRNALLHPHRPRAITPDRQGVRGVDRSIIHQRVEDRFNKAVAGVAGQAFAVGAEYASLPLRSQIATAGLAGT